jgi:hypothetical protein
MHGRIYGQDLGATRRQVSQCIDVNCSGGEEVDVRQKWSMGREKLLRTPHAVM